MCEIIKELSDELAKQEAKYKKACATRAEKFERQKALLEYLKSLKAENTELKNELKKLKKKKGK